MKTEENSVRVIIPAYNAAFTIARCLDAIYASNYKNFETVVVVDGSQDDTATIVRRYPVRLIELKTNGGAARARNLGAEACTSRYILFVDSDIVIGSNTIASIVDRAIVSGADAVSGCYTVLPLSHSICSVYHNLFQHFYFFRYSALRSRNLQTSVFWTGCGLINTTAFKDVGGFDESIPGASIEDDILGANLIEKGYRINIDMGIAVYHDHKYSFIQLVVHYFNRGAIMARAVFTSKLGRTANQGYFNILNLLALVLSYAFIALLIITCITGGEFLVITALALLMFLAININFYIFILRNTTWMFTIFCVPLNFLCYLVSGAGAAMGLLKIRR